MPRRWRGRWRRLKRAYRIAAISRSITGLRAAGAGGLAVSAMVRSAVSDDMRELAAEDGFPVLAKLNIRLERSHLKKSPIIDRLEAHLIARLSQEPAT